MKKLSNLWLIGSGIMAIDYVSVLKNLKQPFDVIGRGQSSALLFKKKTGINVITGGLKAYLRKTPGPEAAIVVVGVEQLADVAKALINSGTKNILLEKPGALNFKEIKSLNSLANKKKAKVYIAYNRRFYQPVKQMLKLIKKDEKILSVNFEFTEWAHAIKPLQFGKGVKEHWLLANSSHVIDLAFYLCGKPKDWKCWNKGTIDWHSSSARFCGSGITDKGVMFSYLSDWQAPGRWSLELLTNKNRFVFKPMEELKVIKLGSVSIETLKSKNKIDKDFAPGLFLQTKNFIEKKDSTFCTLTEQTENMKIYSKMAGY